MAQIQAVGRATERRDARPLVGGPLRRLFAAAGALVRAGQMGPVASVEDARATGARR